MALLNQQLRLYDEQGFLLVSGLIPDRVIERARDDVLERIANPSPGSYHQFYTTPNVSACFTRKVCTTAAELARAHKTFEAPRTVYVITVFPSGPAWDTPAPHIDHANPSDAHKTFPPAFRIGCLIYLNDIQPHEGATVVWPQSHRQVAAFAATDPNKYEYLSALNQNLQTLSLQEPQEITAAAGDVLFYDHFCVHAGSANTGSEPRVALNHKW